MPKKPSDNSNDKDNNDENAATTGASRGTFKDIREIHLGRIQFD
jgi:hypothetical protein